MYASMNIITSLIFDSLNFCLSSTYIQDPASDTLVESIMNYRKFQISNI